RITDAEVDADLRTAGVDMRVAVQRLHDMLEQRKARERFKLASERRASMIDKLRDVKGPKPVDLRTGLREFIARLFSGPELAAHYHKLETAATEEDLQSLADDLAKLAALRESMQSNEQ